MTLIKLTEPEHRPRNPGGFALWALGFRPFYLLAAAFAVIGMLAWLFVLSGRLAMPMAGIW